MKLSGLGAGAKDLAHSAGAKGEGSIGRKPLTSRRSIHRRASAFSGFSLPEMCIRLVLGMYFSIGSTSQLKAILNGLTATPVLEGQGFPETTSHNSWIPLCEYPEHKPGCGPLWKHAKECIVQGDSVTLTPPPTLRITF